MLTAQSGISAPARRVTHENHDASFMMIPIPSRGLPTEHAALVAQEPDSPDIRPVPLT
jgi:hypothetical protein